MSDPYSCIIWILHCLEIAREKNDLLNRFIYPVNINGISVFWIFIVLWSVDLIYIGLIAKDAFILHRCALWNLDLFIPVPELFGVEFVVQVRGAPLYFSFQGHGVRKLKRWTLASGAEPISFLLFDWHGDHWRIIWIKMWGQNSGPVIVFLGKVITCYHEVITDYQRSGELL